MVPINEWGIDPRLGCRVSKAGVGLLGASAVSKGLPYTESVMAQVGSFQEDTCGFRKIIGSFS